MADDLRSNLKKDPKYNTFGAFNIHSTALNSNSSYMSNFRPNSLPIYNNTNTNISNPSSQLENEHNMKQEVNITIK